MYHVVHLTLDVFRFSHYLPLTGCILGCILFRHNEIMCEMQPRLLFGGHFTRGNQFPTNGKPPYVLFSYLVFFLRAAFDTVAHFQLNATYGSVQGCTVKPKMELMQPIERPSEFCIQENALVTCRPSMLCMVQLILSFVSTSFTLARGLEKNRIHSICEPIYEQQVYTLY